MRPNRFVVVALACGAVASAHANPPTLDEVLTDEASLHDVTFLDVARGWAVGDRGLVLRTTDGGERWRRVSVPTDVRLASVQFIDADHGWIVGGDLRPYTHESRGVVLATVDGGRVWRAVSTGVLPRFTKVRFFTPRDGVAAGDGTALHPSGVFTTDDGGAHWRPIPGVNPQQWAAADFRRDRVGELAGVAVGPRGVASRLTGRELTPSIGLEGLRGVAGVAMLDAARGWVVGDGGLVRRTEDGGQSWTPPPAGPPKELARWFDWRSITARDESAWMVGSPGSLMASTADGGRTWRTDPTGVTTPLTSVTFLDQQHGWAVGEFGVIIATRDGGQTWRRQRGDGRRAALGVVIATPEQTPLELIATTSAAEGYRTVVVAPFAPEDPLESASQQSRTAQAATLVGADATAVGWSIPLEPSDAGAPYGVLMERLDRVTDGRAREQLTADLCRWLLTYRPEVVTVPATEARTPGASRLLAEALRLAVAQAEAEPPSFTGLDALRVRRVVATHAEGAAAPLAIGETRQSTTDFSSLLGATPAQWRSSARGLLIKDYATAPAAYRWETLLGADPLADRRADLMTGVTLARGSEARRGVAIASTSQIDRLRRLAAKQRNMRQLLNQSAGDPSWSGQVVNLTGGLDAESGAELLSTLAEGYRAAGEAELAAETLYLLARRYPEAPLADAALLWLTRYYSSAEWARCNAADLAKDARAQSATLSNVASDARAPRLAEPVQEGSLSTAERSERAAALLDFLKQARPGLHAQPAVRFVEAANQRARGFGADADKIALVLSKRAIGADWRRAAEAERWLAKPEGLPPEKPVATCRYTPRRPKLDGRFNEAVWDNADELALRSESGGSATGSVRIAHDEAFLYLAIEAKGVANGTQTLDPASRKRDADLSGSDRVTIRLDTDRDYATAFALSVDQHGQTHDGVDRAPHWEPTWYVAADADARTWRAEAAIPLKELADPQQLARAAWAVSVERRTPSAAASAWPATNHAGSPDAYGFLLFD